MKQHFLKGMAIIGMVCAFIACSNDDDNNDLIIDTGDLPEAGTALLATYFEGATVTRVELKNRADADGTLYEVSLSNGFEIDLDADGNWTDIDGNNRQVPDGLVPEAILAYTREHYPSPVFIEGIDKEVSGYEVDLSNNTDLLFDTDGNFIRTAN
ncbi:PepSY-like domain-containing protein [Sinomicrobium soli]|uniref:PepSY-like domain-containing protein n=1 Tax=Sinomicrobium sp. N-1-3-6 TaxID=2219864 RepID=UPI000DCD1A99|nr:PepSY-like domain-containing protein [Sinomicrobium sp. N-1-3-6]RAV30209.1 hypothetical protein DN748_05295 [Sinomicrobium sp. N-1-3-6]